MSSRNGDDISNNVNNNNINNNKLTNCLPTLTTINGVQSTCKGQLVFEENFTTRKLDETKWRQDCHIPSDEEV